ncbi:hypothetical protein H6G27_07065 [Nostoc linckia FACHB-104]|nr:hypothetical protein [Nostoc linckia FACHB-104]
MFNQEVALNNQAWEEITDIQGEVITGGAAPTEASIVELVVSRVTKIYESNKNFDLAKTIDIVTNVATKNGAINKFFPGLDIDAIIASIIKP